MSQSTAHANAFWSVPSSSEPQIPPFTYTFSVMLNRKMWKTWDLTVCEKCKNCTTKIVFFISITSYGIKQYTKVTDSQYKNVFKLKQKKLQTKKGLRYMYVCICKYMWENQTLKKYNGCGCALVCKPETTKREKGKPPNQFFASLGGEQLEG